MDTSISMKTIQELTSSYYISKCEVCVYVYVCVFVGDLGFKFVVHC